MKTSYLLILLLDVQAHDIRLKGSSNSHKGWPIKLISPPGGGGWEEGSDLTKLGGTSLDVDNLLKKQNTKSLFELIV